MELKNDTRTARRWAQDLLFMPKGGAQLSTDGKRRWTGTLDLTGLKTNTGQCREEGQTRLKIFSTELDVVG